MPADFDALVKLLTDKIVLQGPEGANYALVRKWIAEVCSLDHYASTPVGKSFPRAAGIADSSAPATSVDRALCDAIWKWLKASADVRVESRSSSSLHDHRSRSPVQGPQQNASQYVVGKKRKVSLVEMDQSVATTCEDLLEAPVPSSRDTGESLLPHMTQDDFLVADEQRIWYAITGHGIDREKVPGSPFQLLLIIARSGPDGITQPRLAKLSGQDIRSVPQRTDRLHRDGYIRKSRTLEQNSWTSLCTLKMFEKVHEPITVETMTPDQLCKHIFHDGVLKVNVLLDFLITYMQEWETVALYDLRLRLGVSAHKTERSVTNGMIERMEENNWVEIERIPHKVSVSGFHMTNVKLLYRPSTEEKTELCEAFGQSRGVTSALNPTFSPANFATGREELRPPHIDNAEPVAESVVKPWCPERPLHHPLHDLIEAAGPNGIETPEIIKRLGFQFFRKTLDQVLGRLTDLWTVSQPAHLRHLAIVRDVSMRGKQHQYLYRTYKNCDQAIAAGLLTWEAVMGRNTRLASSPHDAWGFSLLDKEDFFEGDHRASPSQCTRAKRLPTSSGPASIGTMQKRHARRRGIHTGAIQPTRQQEVHRQNKTSPPNTRIGSAKQWMSFEQSTRRMANMAAGITEQSPGREQESKNTYAMSSRPIKRVRVSGPETKETQDESIQHATQSAMSLTKNIELESNPSPALRAEVVEATGDTDRKLKRPMHEEIQGGGPLKSPRLTEDVAKQINVLHEQYMAMSRPGLYINPPQRVPVKRGRPRLKQMFVVIKSDKLYRRQLSKDAIPHQTRIIGKSVFHGADTTEITVHRGPIGHVTVKDSQQSMLGRSSKPGHATSLEGDTDSRRHGVDGAIIPCCQTGSPEPNPRSHTSSHRNSNNADNKSKFISSPQKQRKSTSIDMSSLGTVPTAGPVSERLPLHQDLISNPRPIIISEEGLQSATGSTFADGQRTKANRRGVTIRGGSLGYKRSTTLLKLVEEAGGVYPGGREISLPFKQAWQRSETASTSVDEKTVGRAINGLVQDNRLSRHYFAFRTGQGTVLTKSVLSLPHIPATDAKVISMQKNIESWHPRSYRPGGNDAEDGFETTKHGSIDTAPQRIPTGLTVKGIDTATSRNQNKRDLQAKNQKSRPATIDPVRDMPESNETARKLSSDQAMRERHVEVSPKPDGRGLFAKRSRLQNRARVDAERRARARSVPRSTQRESEATDLQDARLKSLSSLRRPRKNSLSFSGNGLPRLPFHAIGLTAPSQAMHIPSGTFSTDFNPLLLGARRLARDRGSGADAVAVNDGRHLPSNRINTSNLESVANLSDRFENNPESPFHGLGGQSTGGSHKKFRDHEASSKSCEILRVSQTQDYILDNGRLTSTSRTQIASPQTSLQDHFKMGEVEIRRLTSCVCLVQLLAGGVSRKIHWPQVKQMHDPQCSGSVLKQKWRVIRLARAQETRHFRHNLQELFLLEYEAGRTPKVDYQYLGLNEWDSLLQWTLDRWRDLIVPTSQCKLLKTHDRTETSALELPAERQRFEDRHCVVKRGDRSNAARVDITSLMYPARWTAEWLNVSMECNAGARPLIHDYEQDIVTDCEISAAESYVRANIFTPEDRYDSAAAKEKLSVLPSRSLDEALQNLLDNRVIVPKGKGRHIPGRNYKMADRFNMFYARHTLKDFPKSLEDAMAYKISLDADLCPSAGTQLVQSGRVPYHLRDGEALVLCNLAGSGHIKLLAKTPSRTDELARPLDASKDASFGASDIPDRRLSIWGFTTKNYKTMHVEGGNIVYPIEFQPTQHFVAGAPAQERQAMLPVAPMPAERTRISSPIPVWYDIHGGELPELWSQIVGHTGTTLALLPGVNVQYLAAPMGVQAGYFEWETHLVLQWMAERGLAIKVGPTISWKEQGWMATDQWWSLITYIRDGRAEVGEIAGGQRGVEGKAGTMFYSRPHDLWLR